MKNLWFIVLLSSVIVLMAGKIYWDSMENKQQHLYVQNKIDKEMSLTEFGAKGNANYYNSETKKYYEDKSFTIEATDDTESIQKAAVYSQQNNVQIQVPKGNYLFTKTNLWDRTTSFVGIGNRYEAKFIKHFSGDGFRIEAYHSELKNVSVISSESFRDKDKGSGIVLGTSNSSNNTERRANYVQIDVQSMYHGGHGLHCQTGNQGKVEGYFYYNKGDGVHCYVASPSSPDWNANKMHISATGNGRHGLYIHRAETNDIHATVQGNGGYGALINWPGNHGYIYAEDNGQGGVHFGESSQGSDFDVHTVGSLPTYESQDNKVWVRSPSEAKQTYQKIYNLFLENVVDFQITSSATSIPANSYMEFSTSAAHGINQNNGSEISLTINPSEGLAQGLSYEVFFAGTNDKITLRLHNNTDVSIKIPVMTWNGLAFKHFN
ncbi:hypothetical protein M3221_10855 [Domibacillus indicus]|uniref:hypothetical protein n=1 Tax=Domibacillus indicus TaxID=1437523 RepID=UPI00203D972D|nr:hypothetical protein [Domibacillus indicus]MCM3788905.1 hypothetical protein [Domibacillus indicus]